MINRTITPDSLSRARLREFEELYQVIDEHDEPESLPTISKTFGVMKAIDAISVHLRERLGTRKVPLSYVIRENVNPPALEPLATDRLCMQSIEN